MPQALHDAVSSDPPPERRAWKPDEVAKMLGISKTQVYRLIRSGELKARKFGARGTLVSTESLTAFLEHTQS